MEPCELKSQCAFYALVSSRMPRTLKHLEEDYCNVEFSMCVRFMIYRIHGISLIPGYLLPWDIREARIFLVSLNIGRALPDDAPGVLPAKEASMDSCEMKNVCFFHSYLSRHLPRSLAHLEKDYCDTSYAECARFMVYKATGPYHVPKELFPEDIHEACRILDTLNT